MFRTIHIEGFLTCDRVHLENLDSIVALVGQNGAGKSNILKSIERICKFASKGSVDDLPIFEVFNRKHPVKAKLLFQTEDLKFEYCFEAKLPNNEIEPKNLPPKILLEESLLLTRGDKKDVILSRKGENVNVLGGTLKISSDGSALPALIGMLPDDNGSIPRIKSVVEFLSKVKYYPLDELNESKKLYDQFISQQDYSRWRSQLNSATRDDASITYRLLHLYFDRPEDFETVRSHLGASGLNLCDIRITSLKLPAAVLDGLNASDQLPTIQQLHVVHFLPRSASEEANTLLGYGKLSLGTRRIVRLITSMVYDASTVMLLEHPEDGIHRGLLKKLIGLLKAEADPTQFIIASHSPELLNRLEPEQIQLVTLEDGVTVVKALTADQLRLAHEHICDDLELSEFMYQIEQD